MNCPIEHKALTVRAEPVRETAGSKLGIDEVLIKKVVHEFYSRVRDDAMLAPIFNQAIEDWDGHLDKLCAFWSSVLLTTGRYKGTPMQVHVGLSKEHDKGLDETHFAKWLSLFAQTVDEVCDEAIAELFKERANRIAQSLQMAINMNQGRLLG